MKIRTGFILCLFILFCLLFPPCAGRNGAQIYIDGDTYKFGRVKEGENIVFTFFISNRGSGDLLIKDLYISCGCVEVKAYDRLIKPGNRGQVYGVLKTAGLEGEILRAIKLKTNIPDTSPVLSLKGSVYPPGGVSP